MAQKLRGRALPYLRAWRIHRALGQAELAEAAGTSRGTIVRAESGGVVSFANMRALAKALTVTVEQLVSEAPEGEGPGK
jgi:transcriptional regulator with XRE-family HTH domain